MRNLPALQELTPYDLAENDLCEGPFLGGYMPITKGHSLTMSGNACALPVGDISAEDHARVFYYYIFPNMLLSMHPDYVMVHQLWPQSPERTLILCDWFFHPNAAGVTEPPFNPEDAIFFWDMTNKQDWHVCELSQQGIASRAYQPGPYSPRESIPAADFQRLEAANRDNAEAHAFWSIQARNLAKMNAAGVKIVVGTDGNTPYAPHIEMEDMVAAGMTPMQVIVAATRNSAEFLRLADAGTLQAGKSADFIVLDANPLDDITNTRRISAVVLRGAAVDRAPPVR